MQRSSWFNQLELLINFEERNWLYQEFIEEFWEGLRIISRANDIRSDIKMTSAFKLHCHFNRLYEEDQIKNFSADTRNFYYFHDKTMTRKMALFKSWIENIFTAERLRERNVIKRIKDDLRSLVMKFQLKNLPHGALRDSSMKFCSMELFSGIKTF